MTEGTQILDVLFAIGQAASVLVLLIGAYLTRVAEDNPNTATSAVMPIAEFEHMAAVAPKVQLAKLDSLPKSSTAQ